jgi:hypothetical protein
MEEEQMMAHLLAEIRTNRTPERRNKSQHPKEEMLNKSDAHHKRMMARMDSQLEKMEATDLEAHPRKQNM